MSFSIQTNVASLQAQESLRTTSEFQARTINRLTSGYRINSSADDAAGLAVANKFRSDIAELTQGVRNANDGISTLQIVDGGLNNISKMLDRMKTLATQSASGTFTGDRATLDTEFQSLIAEINRQATNVKLNSGGAYNASIGVYIGGSTASANSNASVAIDLSGSTNAVDASSLGVQNASVAGGANAITDAGGAKNLNGATTLLAGSATQTFTVNYVNASNTATSATVTLTGTSSGLTTDQAISQLNSQLSGYGINASLSSTGQLQFAGSGAFSIGIADSTTAGNGLTSSTATVDNRSRYYYDADGLGAGTADATGEQIQIGNGSNTVTVTFGAQATSAAKANLINGLTASLGVQAVVDSAGKLSLSSSSSFTLVKLANATTAGNAVFSAATGTKAVNNPVAGTSATGNAASALSLIADAVQALGKVQGAVGASQNKLQYAINLAQAQISNFSAAESRIRDADVAAEAANLTKAQVMQQASMAAMAQANSAPQAVLALLRG